MSDLHLTDQRIVDLDPQPTIAVRIRKPMADINMRELFDTHLPLVFQFATSHGHEPTGPPYARYFEFGPENLDMEIGIPIADYAAETRADEHLEQPGASELPGGKTAKVVHHGPYDNLAKAYDALREWIHQHDYDEGSGPWESYVDDPSEVSDDDKLRTEIYWPVTGLSS